MGAFFISNRRDKDAPTMTREQARKTTTAVIGIPAAILVVTWLVRWSLETFNAQAAQAQQYVPRTVYDADMARRADFDSAQARTLRRIDARVTAIFCGQIPVAQRPACQ